MHAAKVLIRILTKRIEAKVEGISYIADDQLRFRRGKGTRDAIAALRVIGERSLQHGKDLYVCFVDYEKAFDRVKWHKMMWMLKNIGVDWRDRNLIAKLYLGQKAVITRSSATAQLHTSFSARSLIVHFTEHRTCFTTI